MDGKIHLENKPTSFTDTSRIHKRVPEFRMEIQCLRIARERFELGNYKSRNANRIELRFSTGRWTKPM